MLNLYTVFTSVCIKRILTYFWLLLNWTIFCIFYRQDAAKRQTAGIKFIHRPKIRFFAPQGRIVAPIHIKVGRADADGHVGPLGCAKFHLNRHRWWECGPRYQKFPLFGKESPHRGDSLDRFRKFLGAFICLTILRWCFKFL